MVHRTTQTHTHDCAMSNGVLNQIILFFRGKFGNAYRCRLKKTTILKALALTMYSTVYQNKIASSSKRLGEETIAITRAVTIVHVCHIIYICFNHYSTRLTFKATNASLSLDRQAQNLM